jgi:hypothetical protein
MKRASSRYAFLAAALLTLTAIATVAANSTPDIQKCAAKADIP